MHVVVKNAAGVVVCYYLLSQTQSVFKKISASLVARYEAACTGYVPAGTAGASGRRSSPSVPRCTRLRWLRPMAGKCLRANSTLTSSRARCARDLHMTASASMYLLSRTSSCAQDPRSSKKLQITCATCASLWAEEAQTGSCGEDTCPAALSSPRQLGRGGGGAAPNRTPQSILMRQMKAHLSVFICI